MSKTRLDAIIESITEENIIALIESPVGDELYGSFPPWCGCVRGHCPHNPEGLDDFDLPCREKCIRPWLHSEAPEDDPGWVWSPEEYLS